MESFDLIIKNGEIVNHNQTFTADIGVKNGLIVKIGPNINGASKKILDATGLSILPGLIDSQVHFREPGLTHKEDIESGSKAAVLGGICTYFEMPNTKPATTTVSSIEEKIAIAHKKSYANAYFYIGANGNNLEELKKAQSIPGCCGVKIFLGSSTGDLLLYNKEKLLEIFQNLDCPIAVHCESEDRLNARIAIRDNATSVHAHYDWRDAQSALESTQMIIEVAKAAKRKVHVLHISTKEEIEFLKANKEHCTFELTPQHLTLFAPDSYDNLDTLAQMNPPLRTKDHLEALWRAVDEDIVDVFGSDHAPHTLEEKRKGYPHSPSGMPGVQTIFPIFLSHMNNGKISLEKIIEKLSFNPANLYKLNKGIVQEGRDADFTIVDFKKEWIINNQQQASKCGWTPFYGTVVKGKPVVTIVLGKIVMLKDEVFDRK